jgi:phosphate uptake regulator
MSTTRSEATSFAYEQIVNQITNLSWTTLKDEDLIRSCVGLLLFLRAISRVPRNRSRAFPR